MQAFGLTATRVYKQSFQKFRNVSKKAFSTKYLFYTNVGLSITLSAVGDILEQQYEMYCGDLEKYNPTRTHHMSVSGMTIGMVCHHWYKILDRNFPQRTLKVALKKVIIDQVIASPICIATFFLTLAVLEQSSWTHFREDVKDKAIRLYTAEWVIWPPAQIINFYVLPLRYRVLYDNAISLGYDVYTSRVKHGNVKIGQ